MKGKMLYFVLGLVLGLVVALALPPLVAPWLPAGWSGGEEVTSGVVVAKSLQDDRLLLTLESEQGATLATFTQRVPEIDLLVEEGDRVSLGGTRYEPFIQNPEIRGVEKGARPQAVEEEATEPFEPTPPVPEEEPTPAAEPAPEDEALEAEPPG